MTQQQSEIDAAQKFIEDNAAELEEVGIHSASLHADIAEFTKKIEHTKEFIPKASGNTLSDLIELYTDISKELSRSTVSNCINLGRAIDVALDKVKDESYMVKQNALLRYMNILGLNPYYLFDFELPKENVDYDYVFAADFVPVAEEAERCRAKYSRATYLDKSIHSKERNASYKGLALDTDAYREQTKAHLARCKAILEIMDEPVPNNEMLIPYITFQSLIENIEVSKTGVQMQENLRPDEERDSFVHTGARKVPLQEAKEFWKTFKSKDFQVQRPFDEKSLGSMQKKDKPFIVGLTNKLYESILKESKNKKEAIELFKKLY